jgi:hypothetical protein
MNTAPRTYRLSTLAIAAALALLAGCSGPGMHHGMNNDMNHDMNHGMRLSLSGANEVPAVATQASGMGMIRVGTDRAVSGRIMVSGLAGTMAHIHQGAAGQNGPVVIGLTGNGNEWMVPPGSMLTEAQYEAYKAGNLYVNVHTDANKGGEIRAQLRP